jgi:signal transduction histidine kinase
MLSRKKMALPNQKIETGSPEEILILAPTGQDAGLLADVLHRNGLRCNVYPNMPGICRRLEEDAGLLLIAEEALDNRAIHLLNSALANQEAWSDIPVIVMTSGGETTYASMKVLKELSPAGNVNLLERPFRPITLVSSVQVALRSRRRQFEVRALLEKQQEATRIRDEFISIASHELKTPLTSLKLQAQINMRFLTEHVEPQSAAVVERFRKFVRSSSEQVDRLTRLIEDMLDVSRINAGKLILNRAEVDLAELVREVADRLTPQFSAAGCELTLSLQDNIRGAWDRYRIEQVIINLLTNAIRYGQGKPIHLSLDYANHLATLKVADQGVGIAPENQSRIFERFERAQHSRNIDGLGLGLYICRQIVENHGGEIRVESEPGAGSVFVVTLPDARRLDHHNHLNSGLLGY